MPLLERFAWMPNPNLDQCWTVTKGPGAVLATAIHDGHALRPEVAGKMILPAPDRLREEDPFTGQAVRDVPVNIVVHQSRFEVDLNRGAQSAVYRTPDQCWGLQLWESDPGNALVEGSLAVHAAYYSELARVLDRIAEQHGRFVLIDVHSYNHRRGGPLAEPTAQAEAPDVNIGTFSMPRDDWAWLLDPLIEEMRAFDFNGRRLDVRENAAFQGKGEQTRFVHACYPGQGCAIALEFKKFFMDEWTGEPDPEELQAMRAFITHVAKAAADLLKR